MTTTNRVILAGEIRGAGIMDEAGNWAPGIRQEIEEAVRCVVTDLGLGNNWPLWRAGVERVLAGLPERGYREAWRCGELSVYQLDSACLRCVPGCR